MENVPKQKLTLEELLYLGRYKCILSVTIDSRHGQYEPKDTPYIIGALTFRGRLEEAEHIYERNCSLISKEDLITSHFILGIIFCRNRKYEKARHYFIKNLLYSREKLDSKSLFYVWQGIAFYRNSCGQPQAAYKAFKKSYYYAFEGNFLYGKVLATDLKAHAQIFLGQASAAFESFKEALRYAELSGDGGLLQAVQVSLAIHSAQYGFHPESDVENLEKLNNQISSEDNYSKARLLLELSRQYVLRGSLSKAKAKLDEASRLIYGSQNRWYTIRLSVRYAHVLYLKGEAFQALNLLDSAKKELDPKFNKILLMEVLGLEKKILKKIKTPNVESFEQLLSITNCTQKAIGLKILNRECPQKKLIIPIGDDPLGDLIELSYHKTPEHIQMIVDKGYLSLLRNMVNFEPWDQVLIFDFLPGDLLILDKGNVYYKKGVSTPLMRSLAIKLSHEELDKQGLVAQVWGYQYHPLRHDALVYRAISRFRNYLEEVADWLVLTEKGYRLRDGIKVIRSEITSNLEMDMEEVMPEEESITIAPKINLDLEPSLNHRQVLILKYLEKNDSINAKIYKDISGMSEITSRRDLAELVKIGTLRRYGKGRATTYTKNENEKTKGFI